MPNLKKFLRKHLDQMLVCFKLTHFDVYLKRKNISAKMQIATDLEYLEALIEYGKQAEQAWEQKKHQDLLLWLCHEVTHILLAEIKSKRKRYRFYNERATEHISRLLYELYRRKNALRNLR